MNWYDDRNQKIWAQWLDGSPARDIADRWALDVVTVRKIIHRASKNSLSDAQQDGATAHRKAQERFSDNR